MSVFYNYYKLLDIPIGSDLQTITNAKNSVLEKFYNKPTVASDMLEFERALNEAMLIFLDPLKKEAYDTILIKYYASLEIKKEYKKYGISKANPFVNKTFNTVKNVNSELKKEIKLPVLKYRIVKHALYLLSLWLVSVYFFFNVYEPKYAVLQVFVFFLYLICCPYFLIHVHAYLKVRQTIRSNISAAKATKFATALVCVLPFVTFNIFLKLPNWVINENDPIQCVTDVKVYNGVVNVLYNVNGKWYNRSVFEDYSEFNLNMDTVCKKNLKIQYAKNFPFIVRFTLKK